LNGDLMQTIKTNIQIGALAMLKRGKSIYFLI
jgi:hypothetical protein